MIFVFKLNNDSRESCYKLRCDQSETDTVMDRKTKLQSVIDWLIR